MPPVTTAGGSEYWTRFRVLLARERVRAGRSVLGLLQPRHACSRGDPIAVPIRFAVCWTIWADIGSACHGSSFAGAPVSSINIPRTGRRRFSSLARRRVAPAPFVFTAVSAGLRKPPHSTLLVIGDLPCGEVRGSSTGSDRAGQPAMNAGPSPPAVRPGRPGSLPCGHERLGCDGRSCRLDGGWPNSALRSRIEIRSPWNPIGTRPASTYPRDVDASSPLTTVQLSASGTRVSVRCRTPEASHRGVPPCRFGSDIRVGEIGLALGLLPAMRFGGRLEVGRRGARAPAGRGLPGPGVVPQLGSRTARSVPWVWARSRCARPRGRRAGARRGVGCFFSGGVDSFYTLLKHRREITDLVVVHGFDLPLASDPLRRSLSEAAGDVARVSGQAPDRGRDRRAIARPALRHLEPLLRLRARRRRLRAGFPRSTDLPGHRPHVLEHAPGWRRTRSSTPRGAAVRSRSSRTAPRPRGPRKVAVLAGEPLAMRWLACAGEPRRSYKLRPL